MSFGHTLKFDLVHEEKVLEEESLNSCENSTWASLILENTVLKLLVEKETLAPRVMEVSCVALEQQPLDSLGVCRCNNPG